MLAEAYLQNNSSRLDAKINARLSPGTDVGRSSSWPRSTEPGLATSTAGAPVARPRWPRKTQSPPCSACSMGRAAW